MRRLALALAVLLFACGAQAAPSVCIFPSMLGAVELQARIDTAIGWPAASPVSTTHETAVVPDGPDGPTGGTGAAVILTTRASALLLAGDPTPQTLPATWGLDLVALEAWTPASASPTFWLSVPNASTLTLSGSTVTAATDSAGGAYSLRQSGATALPVLATGAVNGLPAIRFTAAGQEALFSAMGPAAGSDLPADLYVLGRIRDNSATCYGAWATLGAASYTPSGAYLLSGFGAYGWSAIGVTSPLGATLSAANADTGVHVLSLHLSGGLLTVRVDGMLFAGPTAPGAMLTSSAGFPVGFGVGSGVSSWAGDFDVVEAVFRIGGVSDSSALQASHIRYLATVGGVQLPDVIAGPGDSLATSGYDAVEDSPPDPWVTYLASQPGMGGWTFVAFQDGHPGATSAQILTEMTTPGQASPVRRNSLAGMWWGTNDEFQSVIASTTLANIASGYAELTAQGYTVVVVTLMPWVGWTESLRAAVNAGIIATYPNVLDLGSDATLQAGLSLSGGVWVGTYDGIYRSRSTLAGHLTGSTIPSPLGGGQGYVAVRFASVFAALRR